MQFSKVLIIKLSLMCLQSEIEAPSACVKADGNAKTGSGVRSRYSEDVEECSMSLRIMLRINTGENYNFF